MDNTKQQLVERLKSANNVLVTVSRNPSVDALSALLGLTLVLNKQGKHAAAVFSGFVPSTIEFLQPDETIEKNTDSLRDFIIALDKSKADKLRYKVEDNVVKIFITPYKTSISQEDFEFSEGDFNIDVVIAIGVQQQDELDEAITAHGRILHDATVASINIVPDVGLGTINWIEPQASSLSELVTELTQMMGPELLDEQIATALLTGIVSETNRFSNEKTTSVTMSMSAMLMKAGANQQLVASKLEEELNVRRADMTSETISDDQTKGIEPPKDTPGDDGTIRIDHSEETDTDNQVKAEEDSSQPIQEEEIKQVEQQSKNPPLELATEPEVTEAVPSIIENHQSTTLTPGAKLITEPPTLGGTLTANSTNQDGDKVADPLSAPTDTSLSPDAAGMLDIKARDIKPLTASDNTPQPPAGPPSDPVQTPDPQPMVTPPPPAPPEPTPPATASDTSSVPAVVDDATPKIQIDDDGNVTLSDLEQSVDSPHIKNQTVNDARDEVNKAFNETSATSDEHMPPIDSLNAQQLGDDLHPNESKPSSDSTNADQPAAPPVPPPIPFQFGNPPSA